MRSPSLQPTPLYGPSAGWALHTPGPLQGHQGDQKPVSLATEHRDEAHQSQGLGTGAYCSAIHGQRILWNHSLAGTGVSPFLNLIPEK